MIVAEHGHMPTVTPVADTSQRIMAWHGGLLLHRDQWSRRRKFEHSAVAEIDGRSTVCSLVRCPLPRTKLNRKSFNQARVTGSAGRLVDRLV
jgi:hypothetical protein